MAEGAQLTLAQGVYAGLTRASIDLLKRFTERWIAGS
jgi:hypothetical protein